MDVIELISLDSVEVGDPSKTINIVVEIPKGSSIKYEFDTATGLLFVDRKLYTAMNYPFNYGFIPRTLEMDGDPVDALILGEDPVVPLSIVKSRPIGVLLTEDEEGQDSKVIATPVSKIDPTFSKIDDIKDLPEYIENQIKHFFEHYKELEEGKFVKVKGWEGKQGAVKKITDSIQRYKGMSK
ncbi:MAG: inorganic diphosphatase [Nitrososphaeraceae archaeon]